MSSDSVAGFVKECRWPRSEREALSRLDFFEANAKLPIGEE